MKTNNIILALSALFIIASFFIWRSYTDDSPLEEKGFSVNPVSGSSKSGKGESQNEVGIRKDSSNIETQPSNVLLAGVANMRLTTVYKVNIDPDNGQRFIGSNDFLHKDEERTKANNWHGNIMPGLSGVCGYNLVGVSHYDLITQKKKQLFDKPVLIKTLYYPAFSKDTLNNKTVKRDFILVSVYNDDTNNDGFINQKDLRRFYLFNSNGEKQSQIVPENYSVFKSEYDSDNDLMFVFARLDKNKNGETDESEPINIFWLDLKDPTKTGLQY